MTNQKRGTRLIFPPPSSCAVLLERELSQSNSDPHTNLYWLAQNKRRRLPRTRVRTTSTKAACSPAAGSRRGVTTFSRQDLKNASKRHCLRKWYHLVKIAAMARSRGLSFLDLTSFKLCGVARERHEPVPEGHVGAVLGVDGT